MFDAPPELDDVEAVAFTLPFHLGWLALHERAGLQAGETVLVRSGASAVGTAAIQLAVAAGARVIATGGGAAKAELCLGLGAERAVDHDTEDLFDAVMDHTQGHGADVIYDPIGGEQTESLWTCAALGGRYIPVGFNDDPESGLTGRPLRKVSMANVSVDDKTGQPIGAGMSFLRELVSGIVNQVFYLSYLWMLWDTDKVTLADKAVHSTVFVLPKS